MDHHFLLFPVPFLLTILLWLHDHLARPRSLIKKATGLKVWCLQGYPATPVTFSFGSKYALIRRYDP